MLAHPGSWFRFPCPNLYPLMDATETPRPKRIELTDLEKIACPTGPPPGGICIRDAGLMHRRLIGERGDCSHYHVMSRTVGAELLFGDEEKEAFRILLWRLARFSGVEVLTFCVMGNHFHLLIRIPKREQFLSKFDSVEPGDVGELRLLKHLTLLYSVAYLKRLRSEIEELRRQGREPEVQRVLGAYKARFCDLSLFVKELKERFSRWFNQRHSRRGTLWMERFRSVIVEAGTCLRTVAAYIDLNPVRAGLVERPEDYRWCGYTEALGGSKRIRRGLCRVIGWPPCQWSACGRRNQSGSAAYRCLLYEEGMEEAVGSSTGRRRGIEIDEARKVIARGGHLRPSELLKHRVRWFSEGRALGSEGFLRKVLGGGEKLESPRALPVDQEGEGSAWFSLSRLRGQGIG